MVDDKPDVARTELAERVKKRMKDLGISQAEIARRGRFNRAFVSDLIVGRKTKLRDQNYMRLAQALMTTPQYLRWGTQPSAEELAQLGAQDPFPASVDQDDISAEDLEILGRAFESSTFDQTSYIPPISEARQPSGWAKSHTIPMFRSEGRSDGAAIIRSPAAQTIRAPHFAAKDWYAIAIGDSTMTPRYEAGDCVYAMQATRVRAKDFVVVRVASRVVRTPVQLGYVRQMLRRTAEEIVVRQLSPNIETVIRQTSVLSVDRILLAGEIVDDETEN